MAPALEKLGLNKMAVHMFIFYWGMLSSITPPVAIASFAAAGIAGAPAMKTGWESMKVGSIIYFIPFFFVMAPELVLQGPNPYLTALVLAGKAAAGTLIICGGIQGYMTGIGDLRGAGWLEWPIRIALIVGGIVLATPAASILPVSMMQLILIALTILAPALLVARALVPRPATVQRSLRESIGPSFVGTAQPKRSRLCSVQLFMSINSPRICSERASQPSRT